MEKLIQTAILLILSSLLISCASIAPSGKTTKDFLTLSDGTKIYYEISEKTNADSVVLIHGGQLSSVEWDSQFRYLAKDFQVVRYDARGFGNSDLQTQTFAHYKDLKEILDQLGIKRAHIVGASMGGGIAIDFALEYPDRVRSLTLIGAVANGYQYSRAMMQRVTYYKAFYKEGLEHATNMWLDDPYYIPGKEKPSARKQFKKLHMKHGAKSYQIAIKYTQIATPYAINRLNEVKAPTLIMVGSLDISDVKDNAALFKKNFADSTLVEVENVGHLMHFEKADEINKTITDFIKEHHD